MRVCLLFYGFTPYCLNAGPDMSVYKMSKRSENITLDRAFMEGCAGKGLTPKGMRWNLEIQGLSQQTEEKVEKIKRDAEA